MVQLPLSALRRRASPSSGVLWVDSSASCSKVQAIVCTQNTAIVDELLQENESKFPRQQIASLDEAYDVEKVLGTGGFGIVQKATLRSDGGPASAIKTIAKTTHVTRSIANAEIQILQQLTHSSICKLLSVCEDPEHIHLVLEYVHGHELFEEILPDRPMKESRAARIMRQTFEALQYCHQLDIIHRDLKPENIMVADTGDTEEPQVKIIDWGLAAVCRDTIQTPLVGTAHYMSPEALSVGIYSRASDMWSAGAVLFMVLTGGDLPPQFKPLGSWNGSQTRPLNELAISKAAQDILHSLLQRMPEKRLTATSAVAHQWTQAKSLCAAPATVQGENAPCCQLDNVDRTSLSVARPLHVEGKLASTGDCIQASLDQLCWADVDFSNCPGVDFAVFDDFGQAGQSPTGNAKQPQHQQSSGIRNEIHGGVLQGPTTTSKPRGHVLRCTGESWALCKENHRPRAPRVCKQLPVTVPAFSQKCMGALSDCARKDALRSRPMR